MKEKYALLLFSSILIAIFAFTAYTMFFTIAVTDISGGGNIEGNRSSNVSFTLVNNMFIDKQLSYKWALDDSKAGTPMSVGLTGSGNVTLPARSSCKITAVAQPPHYTTDSGESHYYGGEGTYLDLKIFDGDKCIYHTPFWSE